MTELELDPIYVSAEPEQLVIKLYWFSKRVMKENHLIPGLLLFFFFLHMFHAQCVAQGGAQAGLNSEPWDQESDA